MKQRILFAVPPYYRMGYGTPYGIGIVATMTKQAGFEVQVLLAEAGETISDYNKRVVQEIITNNIDVVAMGGGSSHYASIELLISMVKDAGALVILGGYIVDSSPEIVTTHIGADYCVYGEGELTFVELLKALKDNLEINDVKGILFLRDGEVIRTPARACVSDLDELPFIDGDLVHYDYMLKFDSVFPLLLSRSCPYQCTFCYHIEGAYYRTKSIDYIFRELEHYIGQYGDKIKSLTVQDDLFNVNKERVLAFCDHIKRYNLPFIVQTRIDFVDEESLRALKEAGAITVGYGLESASNKVLKSMKKEYTIEQAKKAFDLTIKNGLKIQTNIIIGDIEDDAETVRESEMFFNQYALKYDLTIGKISVYPNTQLYKYAVKNEIIKDELAFIRAGCPFINVSKLSDEDYALLHDKHFSMNTSKNMIARKPIEKESPEVSVYRDGMADYTCYCPLCNAKIIVINIDIMDYQKDMLLTGCHQCGQRVDITLTRLFSAPKSDLYLIKNLSKAFFDQYDGKIVIWGMRDPIRRLLIASQTLRDSLVKIVDINYQKYANETYCGLSIEDPETLKDIAFDYVLTLIIPERRHQVLLALDKMGIKSKLIEFV